MNVAIEPIDDLSLRSGDCYLRGNHGAMISMMAPAFVRVEVYVDARYI